MRFLVLILVYISCTILGMYLSGPITHPQGSENYGYFIIHVTGMFFFVLWMVKYIKHWRMQTFLHKFFTHPELQIHCDKKLKELALMLKDICEDETKLKQRFKKESDNLMLQLEVVGAGAKVQRMKRKFWSAHGAAQAKGLITHPKWMDYCTA